MSMPWDRDCWDELPDTDAEFEEWCEAWEKNVRLGHLPPAAPPYWPRPTSSTEDDEPPF